MCWSEKGDFKVIKKFSIQKMLREYERQWSRKKSYVMKWKQSGNSHILVTGEVQVEGVRLL